MDDSGKGAAAAGAHSDAESPKYRHPKILLVDMPDSAAQLLREGGYVVEQGTFGPLVKVPKSREHVPLPYTGDLPNHREQELIVVDTAIRAPVEHDLPDHPHHGKWLWERAARGFVDPRPWAMSRVKRDFDRIHQHGGVFICFAAPKYPASYQYTESARQADLEYGDNEILSGWDFLSLFSHVNVRDDDEGEEINAEPVADNFPGLPGALENAIFACTLDCDYTLSDRWIPLAKNKFGQTVAAVIVGEKDSDQGIIFLLPRLRDGGAYLKRLIEETIPNFAPELFPHVKGGAWVKNPPYELPQVAELRFKIREIEEEAKETADKLREQIEAQREEYGFLPDLLTESGDRLVAAVKKTLELLGFQDVKDVDEEIEDGKPRREDLQLWDRDPVLVSEVKGIGGLPREADALQVYKYLAPRMKEWDRTAQGLTIINHQLKVAGLERQHTNVFQPDVVTSAKAYGVGLLTTWDLFRLARSRLRHDWQPDRVIEIFYGYGLIDPIPTHYQQVGTVDRLYEEASAVILDLTDEIKKGDTLAYELPIEFEEETIASIHLNNAAVERASEDDTVGIKTSLTKEQARSGIRVFRVADTD